MSTGAILTMVITMVIVTGFAGFFFLRVLKPPKRTE
jgi:hypothetical protein